jgi:hypothetical protein
MVSGLQLAVRDRGRAPWSAASLARPTGRGTGNSGGLPVTLRHVRNGTNRTHGTYRTAQTQKTDAGSAQTVNGKPQTVNR